MLYAFAYQYEDGPIYLYGASDFQEAYYYWASECPNDAALVSKIEDDDSAKYSVKYIIAGNNGIRVYEFEFAAGAVGVFS